jgi:preprotein translocase subunit SecE
MNKERAATDSPRLRGLFQLGIYKRSQGRITRQVTFAFLAITVALGVWSFWNTIEDWRFGGVTIAGLLGTSVDAAERALHGLLCGAMLLGGCWIAYRLVNMPRFADFLIAVEAEMNKVSWPTQSEMIRAVLVVLFTIAFLVLVLFGYDLCLDWLIRSVIGIGKA